MREPETIERLYLGFDGFFIGEEQHCACVAGPSTLYRLSAQIARQSLPIPKKQDLSY